MATTIDQLQIEITSNSEGANKGLKALEQTLKRIKVTSESSGLDTLCAKLEKIASINFSNLAPFEKLGNLTNNLEQMTDGIKKATKAMENMPDSFKKLSGIDGIDHTAQGIGEIVKNLQNIPEIGNIDMGLSGADSVANVTDDMVDNMIDTTHRAEILEMKLKGVRERLKEALATPETTDSKALGNLIEQAQKLQSQLAGTKLNLLDSDSLGKATSGVLGDILETTSQADLLQMKLDGVKAKLANAMNNPDTDNGAIANLIGQAQKLQVQLDGISAKSIKTGGAINKLGNYFRKLGIKAKTSIGNSFKSISQLFKIVVGYGTAFRAFMLFTQGISEGLQNLSKYSNETANSMNKLSTMSQYLKNSIGASLYPVVVALTPALESITNSVIKALNAFNQFVSAWSGATTFIKANKVMKEYGETGKKTADKIKRSFAKLDEITVIGENNNAESSTPDYSSMFDEAPISKKTQEIVKMIQDNLTTVKTILGGAALVLGAILTFSGASIPLGLGLLYVGAKLIASAVSENWNKTDGKIEDKLSSLFVVIGAVTLVVGAILAFSGVALPLGIALMAGGAALLGYTAVMNWEGMPAKIKNTLSVVMGIVALAALAIGIVLVASTVALPLGIGLIAIGAVGLAAAVALNWEGIKNKIKVVLSGVLSVISGAGVILGILLCLTGAGIPLGIGLILTSIKGVKKASDINDNPVTRFVKRMVNGIINIFENGINFIINKLNRLSWKVPDWVPGIGGGTFGFNVTPIRIPRLKNGGFPDGEDGLFYANHTELVGKFSNGKTAVANNEQIVEGISRGVSDANSEQNALLREQNNLLRQLIEKNGNIKAFVTASDITGALNRVSRRNGAPAL